ncbi:uncharacterized protein CXorf21 [Denticeps clupeoides]|nr:uncharacterized protein CXorf21 homolog [Denticeps clupeoides]
MDIPGHAGSGTMEAFLVPSSCQSICQHYSDLHIAGDQVLPLGAGMCDLQVTRSQDVEPGPFLLSWDELPTASPDEAPLLPPSQALRGGVGHDLACWREGSGRERPSLQLPGRPLSNSQLNRYLEQKLMELYRQYLTQGPAPPVLASELVQSSLDQITMQLSRERNLEAGRAKDMVVSCLLRMASGLQSSEISTPLLQISTETG